jgi:hypothetical protein
VPLFVVFAAGRLLPELATGTRSGVAILQSAAQRVVALAAQRSP